MTRRHATALLSTMTLLSCSAPDRGGNRWHEEQPRLRVVVALPRGVGVATATALAAPPVRFDALVQPDPNHVLQIASPSTGTLGYIRPNGTVRRGDTLALVERHEGASADRAPVVAAREGTWRSSQRTGQFAWVGEWLGFLEQRGYWLAVGMVSDLESRLIHSSDPARVERRGVPSVPGRVERVRRPSGGYAYSVEVAVEFVVSGDSVPERWRDVTVVITPADSQDSLAAVPATAVVRLPPGSAVFIPVGPDTYEVVWVSTGPPANEREVVITNGVRPGMRVVASGAVVPTLALAARDSLALRARAR